MRDEQQASAYYSLFFCCIYCICRTCDLPIHIHTRSSHANQTSGVVYWLVCFCVCVCVRFCCCCCFVLFVFCSVGSFACARARIHYVCCECAFDSIRAKCVQCIVVVYFLQRVKNKIFSSFHFLFLSLSHTHTLSYSP